MKVIILNDTSSSSHAGCQLTIESMRAQCKRVGMEVVETVYSYCQDLKDHYKMFEKADLLIVNGEGSTHDNHRTELLKVAQHFPAVLINCVFQNNTDLNGLKDFKYIAARESFSAAEVGGEVVPDVVYASLPVIFHQPKEPECDIGITDSCYMGKKFDVKFHMQPKFLLDCLSRYSRICTGRFHGVVLCSMLGIPFSAFNGNTWKIEGLLHDMEIPHLYFEERAYALQNVPKEVHPKVVKYVSSAKDRVEAMFDKIKELI